jgi:hypothetical protein
VSLAKVIELAQLALNTRLAKKKYQVCVSKERG